LSRYKTYEFRGVEAGIEWQFGSVWPMKVGFALCFGLKAGAFIYGLN